MRQTFLLAGLAATANASPAAQAIDFAAVNAAPSPALQGPPFSSNSQNAIYNTASVAASGSAAATGVATASATATQLSKRFFPIWWPWGPHLSSSSPTWPVKTTSTYAPVKTSSSVASWNPSVTPTTTTSQISTTSATTNSDTSCPTQPEEGTFCGFINPEDPCAPQPDGYGPKVTPDAAEAFLEFPKFHDEARSAKTPASYALKFVDYNASVSANTYLGLKTLSSYDVNNCSIYCDNTNLCTGFNIYIERDPSLNPSENCTLPSSITNYKCTLWGSGVTAAAATNAGQNRGQFQVVIAGSKGYEKTNTTTPPSQPGWQPPNHCGGNGSKSHNHPSTCIGQHFFPGPYDPAICRAFAEAQTAKNQASSWWQQTIRYWSGGYNPLKCNFFNSYMLKKNDHPLGTYCSIFTQQWGPSDATYAPGWHGSDIWSIESSWGYSIKN